METVLTDVEARVLGALMEKEITTPDYYPLSLNALVNACNQKSNREPVMDLEEDAVRKALHSLELQGYAGQGGGFDSRVPKFEHRLQEVLNLTRAENAVLCVLLLRGPQTPGELRGRTERLYPFTELSDVQSTLQRLMKHEPPLVAVLPRQPGTKEARYMHLFSGDAPSEAAANPTQAASTASAVMTTEDNERLAGLEDEVSVLKQEVAALKQQLADFRKQFE